MNKLEESPVIDLEMVQTFIIVVAVIIWILTGILLWKSPTYIPLFFSKPYGRGQLANHWWLLLYPVFSLVLYFFGYLIKNKMKSSPISTSMTIWVNFGSIVLLLLSEIFIATLVF